MNIAKMTLISIFFFGSWCFAGSRIAFLELYDRQGKLVQYEPGGRFAHTAIQFDEIGDLWLNSYPGEGVALVSWQTLQTRGVVAEIIEVPLDARWDQAVQFLGKPFDFDYSWSDEAYYCTELIAKLLDVPTHPMRFNREVWPERYWKLEGTPGLSPDQLWKWAHELNRAPGRPSRLCLKTFTG